MKRVAAVVGLWLCVAVATAGIKFYPAPGIAAPTVGGRNGIYPFRTAAAAPSSLLTGLVSWWKLDEASGTRADSTGSFPLTDNNTVGSAAKGGGAPANLPATVASFVIANQEYLSASPFSVGSGSASVSIWFNSNVAGTEGIFMLGDAYATDVLLDAWVAATGALTVEVNGATSIHTYGAGTIVAGTWHHLYVEYDDASTKGGCSLDGGTFFQSAATTRQDPGAILVGTLRTNQFYIGGLLSSGGVWSRVLTSAEQACVVNGGDAGVYPFTGLCN